MPKYAVTDNYLRVVDQQFELNCSNFLRLMRYGLKEITPRHGICTEDILALHDPSKQMFVFDSLDEAKVMAITMCQRHSSDRYANGLKYFDSPVIFKFDDLPKSQFQNLSEPAIQNYAKPNGTLYSSSIHHKGILQPEHLAFKKAQQYFKVQTPRFACQETDEKPTAAYYMDAYGVFQKSYLFQAPILRHVL